MQIESWAKRSSVGSTRARKLSAMSCTERVSKRIKAVPVSISSIHRFRYDTTLRTKWPSKGYVVHLSYSDYERIWYGSFQKSEPEYTPQTWHGSCCKDATEMDPHFMETVVYVPNFAVPLVLQEGYIVCGSASWTSGPSAEATKAASPGVIYGFCRGS